MTTLAAAMIRGGILPPSFLKRIQPPKPRWPRLKPTEPKTVKVDMKTGKVIQ